MNKDLVALKEVQRAAHFLGLGLGNLINVFGPEIVIVGGGVAGALGDSYIDLVRTAARSDILTDPSGTIRIERARLGDDAGILGRGLARPGEVALIRNQEGDRGTEPPPPQSHVRHRSVVGAPSGDPRSATSCGAVPEHEI